MLIRARYISTFFAFLSIIGLGVCFPIAISGEKHLKQTEWVIRQSKVGSKKVLYLLDYINLSFLRHKTHHWFKEYVRKHDQKVHVKLLSQTRAVNAQIFFIKIIRRFYFKKMSIDGYDNFCMNSKTSESSQCNHLLTSRWINKKRNLNSKEKEGSDGCRTGFS